MTDLNQFGEPPNQSELAALFAAEVTSAAGKPLKTEFTKVTQPSPSAHMFVDKRVIRILGAIDDEMASRVIDMMRFLEDLDPNADIELRINSPGGSVTAGLAIYDTMRDLNCDIRTVCEGRAASMAAILLAAGTPGKRSLMPNATVMVHGPSGGAEGTYPDMKRQFEEIGRLRAVMIELLSLHTGLTGAQVADLFDRDNYMSPDDAQKWGVIDSIRKPRHPIVQADKAAAPPPFRRDQSGDSPTVN